MRSQDLAEIWKQNLSEQKQSGLNIATWCSIKGISRHKYFYWRKRLQSTPPAVNRSVAWLPVNVEPAAQSSYEYMDSISIYIGPARIELQKGFDRVLFREIVETLHSI